MANFDKTARLAALQQKLIDEQSKVNREIEIFESLPDLPINPKFIHTHTLYGVMGTVVYAPDFRETILPYIQQILEAYPAIAINKTAPGSTYSSFLPDVEHCKDIYTDKRNTVTGWLDAGYYLFEMGAVESYYNKPSAKIEWFTWLNNEVIKINIDLGEISQSMIRYYELQRRAHNGDKYGVEFSDRWSNGIGKSRQWSSTPGLNTYRIWHPKSLDAFEIFDFEGLIPELSH